jgi:general secretion pathway protein A
MLPRGESQPKRAPGADGVVTAPRSGGADPSPLHIDRGIPYAAYFGLAEPPFSISPDPRFLYLSERHRGALVHLLYGVREGGSIVQLTGEVGTGKTTLCRWLVDQLPPDVDVALVLNPRLNAIELLATVCDELHIEYPRTPRSLKVLVDALYQHLLGAHGQGRRTILIIDEAQNLTIDVLEQIRLLTNLETREAKLLQVLLIGQPELVRLLDQHKLRQLAQRITVRYHLAPFSLEETGAYVRHRLAVAGQRHPLFTGAAIRRIHRWSRGIPRLINLVCDRALLGAYAHDRHRVDAFVVCRAAREVRGRTRHSRERIGWHGALAGLAVATFAGGAVVSPLVTPYLTRPGDTVQLAVSTPSSTRVSPDVVPAMPPEPSERAPSLPDVLARMPVRPDERAAFVHLLARWGVSARPEDAADCELARRNGLVCSRGVGTWRKLRRLNVPAIIDLVPGPDRRAFATVIALEAQQATLELGSRTVMCPLDEVDAVWDGAFLFLWKPPARVTMPIRRDDRGASVDWLRQRLFEVDGLATSPARADLFDAELQAQVVRFQRREGLTPDGVVGPETLSHLTLTAKDPAIPRLLHSRQ